MKIFKIKNPSVFKRISKKCKHRNISKDGKNSFCVNCGVFIGLTKHNLYNQEIIENPHTEFQRLIDEHSKEKEDSLCLSFPGWYLNIRQEQVQFLISLYEQFKSTLKTLYLAIEYIDVIFSKYHKKLKHSSVYLITVTSFILAYKFNEMEKKEDQLFSFEDNFKFRSLDEMKLYEIKCLRKLRYKLNRVTVFAILNQMKYSGLAFEKEGNYGEGFLKTLYKEINTTLKKLITNSELFNRYTYLQIALSVVSLVREKMGLNEMKESEILILNYYGYRLEEYADCLRKVKKLLAEEENGEEEKEENESKEKTPSILRRFNTQISRSDSKNAVTNFDCVNMQGASSETGRYYGSNENIRCSNINNDYFEAASNSHNMTLAKKNDEIMNFKASSYRKPKRLIYHSSSSVVDDVYKSAEVHLKTRPRIFQGLVLPKIKL